jgi:RimK-like ATPgrasp N-terminal domain
MMGWLILVDHEKDFPNSETPHKVITTGDYLKRPTLFQGTRPKIINLSRSYAYQGSGYYCSLLAEARRHRIVPTVETMLELSRKDLYEHALPELEDELNKAVKKAFVAGCWSISGAWIIQALVRLAACCSTGFARRSLKSR